MNAVLSILRPAGSPAKAPTTPTDLGQADAERWVVKVEDLKQQRAAVGQDIAAANDTQRDALMAGTAATADSDKVASLEARARGLDAAIIEGGKRVTAAREAEKAAQIEQARVNAARLLAAYRAAMIESGRAVAVAYRAFQADYAALGAYQKCIAAAGLPDQGRALGAPADELLLFVSRASRALETLLSADDFKATGLPRYMDVRWEENKS